MSDIHPAAIPYLYNNNINNNKFYNILLIITIILIIILIFTLMIYKNIHIVNDKI